MKSGNTWLRAFLSAHHFGSAELLSARTHYDIDKRLPQRLEGPGPHYVKTHRVLSPDHLSSRAVAIRRDPRDVCVSLSNHAAISHDRACEDMLTPGLQGRPGESISSWTENVLSWRAHPDVIHLTYENLVSDPVSGFGALLEWLREPTGRLGECIDMASFPKLQEWECSGGFRENSKGVFFKRGMVGTWKTELEPELAEKLEEEMKRT